METLSKENVLFVLLIEEAEAEVERLGRKGAQRGFLKILHLGMFL